MYPSEYLYTREHEWVRVEEDVCVLGITAYAQKELGDVVYVEVPSVGQSVATEDEIGSLESVKAVAQLFTPVSGEIIEVNPRLEGEPELVNDDPHGEGWIAKIRLSSRAELSGLMSAQDYESYIRSGDD